MNAGCRAGEFSINSAPMFHLRLFGSPSLSGEDGSPFTGRAAQRHRIALLALFALAPSQRLSREKVLAYLWPESEPEKARNLLNVANYVLRSELGEGALVSAGEDLRLNTEVVGADVAEFETALENSDYERAVALYGGPFLDGFFLSDAPEFEQWAERERERLAGCYGKALESPGRDGRVRAGSGEGRGVVEVTRGAGSVRFARCAPPDAGVGGQREPRRSAPARFDPPATSSR